MGIGFRPLGPRLVLEKIETEEKTAGGIIIPDTAKEKPTQGRVVAVGPGRTLEDGTVVPLQVKEGDVVLFAKWGGTDVTLNRKEYTIMKEDDILGIVE